MNCYISHHSTLPPSSCSSFPSHALMLVSFECQFLPVLSCLSMIQNPAATALIDWKAMNYLNPLVSVFPDRINTASVLSGWTYKKCSETETIEHVWTLTSSFSPEVEIMGSWNKDMQFPSLLKLDRNWDESNVKSDRFLELRNTAALALWNPHWEHWEIPVLPKNPGLQSKTESEDSVCR